MTKKTESVYIVFSTLNSKVTTPCDRKRGTTLRFSRASCVAGRPAGSRGGGDGGSGGDGGGGDGGGGRGGGGDGGGCRSIHAAEAQQAQQYAARLRKHTGDGLGGFGGGGGGAGSTMMSAVVCEVLL